MSSESHNCWWNKAGTLGMISRKIVVSAVQFLGEREGNFSKKSNINDIVTQS